MSNENAQQIDSANAGSAIASPSSLVSAMISMRNHNVFVIAILALLMGCATKPSSASRDIRKTLLQAARGKDSRFPDGQNVILTHFSHVGELRTSHGQRIYVADQLAVLAGMLAPRGQNRISFFDERLEYLGSIGYIHSRPLWCDGSKLYLFGDLDGFPQPGQEYPPGGNVIDVSAGFDALTSYHAIAYGSSGGIEDSSAEPSSPPNAGSASLHQHR